MGRNIDRIREMNVEQKTKAQPAEPAPAQTPIPPPAEPLVVMRACGHAETMPAIAGEDPAATDVRKNRLGRKRCTACKAETQEQETDCRKAGQENWQANR